MRAYRRDFLSSLQWQSSAESIWDLEVAVSKDFHKQHDGRCPHIGKSNDRHKLALAFVFNIRFDLTQVAPHLSHLVDHLADLPSDRRCKQ